MVIGGLTNRAMVKRWGAFALAFCICALTAIVLFTPAGSNTLTAMQQAQESLDDFLNRSPGERSATLVLKGKGGGKGAVLAESSADDGPTEEALGKVFDFLGEEPGEELVDALPSDGENPPALAMVPDVLVPEGFVPGGPPPFGGGFGGGIPGGGGPGGGTPPGGGGGGGGGNPPPVGAIPEPATWVLLIFGFMTCGAAMRRERAALRRARHA